MRVVSPKPDLNRFSSRRGTLLVVVMMVAAVLIPSAATAAENESQDFFAPLEQALSASEAASAIARLEARPTTRQVALAVPRVEQLAGSAVTFNIFDRSLVFNTESREEGGLRWLGNDGAGGTAIIVSTGQAVAGTITLADGSMYSLSPVGSGVVAVVDVDASQFPPEGESPSAPGGELLDPADVEPGADDGSVFTVIVAYTAAARVANGGKAGIEALITLAETESNTAYANSGIATSMDIVHMYETPTVETTPGDDLDSFTDCNGSGATYPPIGCYPTYDGRFDEVHALRDTHAADLAVLIADYAGTCGLGWTPSAPNVNYAFSVVTDSCATGNYSFSHEIGHNFGADHDLITTGAEPGYNHGHIFTGNPSGTTWRTIMAYGSSCGGCTRVQYFSNPDVNFDGTATGTVTQEDNARVHDEGALTMANFRTSPAPPVVDSEVLQIAAVDHIAVLFVDQVTGATHVDVRDVGTGALKSSVSFGSTYVGTDLEIMPDTPDAGNKPELVVLGTRANGAVRATARDSVTGALAGRANYGAAYSGTDLEILGMDMAVLGTKTTNLNVRVQTRTLADAVVGTAFLGNAWSGSNLEVFNTNLGVLGAKYANKNVRVRTVNPITGAVVANAYWGTAFSGLDLEKSGSNWAVLQQKYSPTGAVRVQTRTTAGVKTATVSFGITPYRPSDLEIVAGNLAVMGKSTANQAVRVQTRSTAGALVGTANYGTVFSGIDLETVGGDLAVLGVKASNNKARDQVRDTSGLVVTTINYN